MKFVQMLRQHRQLGHDGSLEKLAVPLWPDAGKALGLSRNHAYDAARAGEIPTVKFGRTIGVPLATGSQTTPGRNSRAAGVQKTHSAMARPAAERATSRRHLSSAAAPRPWLATAAATKRSPPGRGRGVIKPDH